MARSFGAVRNAAGSVPVRSGNFHHDAAGQDYGITARGGAAYLRRSTTGHDGKPADVLEAALQYWIGSGNHARSYVTRGSRGQLLELPLTWYAGEGGHWAMSPGYDLPFHAGFTRKITYGCLFCHAGYPDLPPGASQSSADWKLPERLGEGIDCQRCHGPGQAHVEAAKQGRTPEQVRTAIVNPKKLDPERGMEVCLQCHLETTTVRLPGFLVKYDRGIFSYRAGEPLEQFMLHFDRARRAPEEQHLEFAGEAYRMRMSACFRESKGTLTCMTCHNPHDVPRGERATRQYADVCQSCHQGSVTKLVQAGRHPASNDCVTCHMPKRKPVDALHTMVSDHWIRKRPQPETTAVRVEQNDSTVAPYRGEVMSYYPPSLPKTPENDLYLAVAQVKHRANLGAGLPRLEQLIESLKPPLGEFYLDAAEANRQVGRLDKAVEFARQATERMQENWRSWFTLGTMLSAAGNPSEAIKALDRATTLAPDEPSVAQALGEVYRREGKFSEAITAFRAAVTAEPEFAEGHSNLGTALLRIGATAEAEKELREAVRLRPESSAMQVNLATFLSRRGGLPEARRRFELALKMNPSFAEGHSAFGAALAAHGDWPAARLHLQTATKLNPESPVLRHNLGMVLLELKDGEEALRQFRSAVELNPDYYEAHFRLGLLLVQRGQREEADPHLRKALDSPDTQVKQAAAQVLQK